jgi:hypothetical protein
MAEYRAYKSDLSGEQIEEGKRVRVRISIVKDDDSRYAMAFDLAESEVDDCLPRPMGVHWEPVARTGPPKGSVRRTVKKAAAKKRK